MVYLHIWNLLKYSRNVKKMKTFPNCYLIAGTISSFTRINKEKATYIVTESLDWYSVKAVNAALAVGKLDGFV